MLELQCWGCRDEAAIPCREDVVLEKLQWRMSGLLTIKLSLTDEEEHRLAF